MLTWITSSKSQFMSGTQRFPVASSRCVVAKCWSSSSPQNWEPWWWGTAATTGRNWKRWVYVSLQGSSMAWGGVPRAPSSKSRVWRTLLHLRGHFLLLNASGIYSIHHNLLIYKIHFFLFVFWGRLPSTREITQPHIPLWNYFGKHFMSFHWKRRRSFSVSIRILNMVFIRY